MTSPKDTKIEEIITEFDEKLGGGLTHNPEYKKMILGFFRTSLSSYASFIEGEMRERGYCIRCNKWLMLHPNEILEELIEKIEGMKKDTDEGTLEELPDQLIYNNAIDDVLALLTNEKIQ